MEFFTISGGDAWIKPFFVVTRSMCNLYINTVKEPIVYTWIHCWCISTFCSLFLNYFLHSASMWCAIFFTLSDWLCIIMWPLDLLRQRLYKPSQANPTLYTDKIKTYVAAADFIHVMTNMLKWMYCLRTEWKQNLLYVGTASFLFNTIILWMKENLIGDKNSCMKDGTYPLW